MKIKQSLTLACLLAVSGWSGNQIMAENRIDTQLPLAPELAAYGPHTIGVRQLELVNPGQIDIVQIDPSQAAPDPLPRYDRPLTLEIWYPSSPYATGSRVLRAFMRDAKTELDLYGKAVQWAAPAKNEKNFPLVIISHGYPGNRFLLSHLAENLASKGYVVASIDHTDSTYRTQAAFGSTLVNRSIDQMFVLNEMARLSADESHFLHEMVDASRTAIVGYSMGGYGAVISSGAGVTQTSIEFPWGGPFGTLAVHKAGSAEHEALLDPRVKTSIAFAPWGMNTGFWDAEGLSGIRIPMLFIAGSQDDVSGYENGTRAIWEGATGVDRSLLTFDHANHNAGAPFPAPEESFEFDAHLGFYPAEHYGDAVWDTARMNNISQHFATAWLGLHLKDESENQRFLDLVENSNDGIYQLEDGVPTEAHTYWAGFPNRTAKGLRFETLSAGE